MFLLQTFYDTIYSPCTHKILTHNIAIEIITQHWNAKKYTLNDQNIKFCKYFYKIKKGKWHQIKF